MVDRRFLSEVKDSMPRAVPSMSSSQPTTERRRKDVRANSSEINVETEVELMHFVSCGWHNVRYRKWILLNKPTKTL